MKVLVVAEKPKMARTIAFALGKYRVRKVGKITVYDLSLDGESVTIFPLLGHIKEIETAPKYRRWGEVDPAKLLTDPDALIRVVSKPSIVASLRSEARGVNKIVIATDPDEEGEDIGLEALEVVNGVANGFEVKRLWLPTTNLADIRRRWKSLVEPKTNLAYAVEARRYLDALIGFPATRELSLNLQHLTRRLGTHILSVGRCQTALLWLLYRREKEILNFVPEPFWVVQATFSHRNVDFKGVHISSPFKEEAAAKRVHEICRVAKTGSILLFEEKVVEELPPTPLNTSKMLQMVTRHIGITAARAMKIAEDLYLEGYITYPRTNTDRYTAFSHKMNLERLSKQSILGQYVRKLLEREMVKPRNGHIYEGDHEPITPIQPLSRNEMKKLTQLHYEVYELILRRYLALFGPPARVSKAEARLDVEGEVFVANGLKVHDPGFMTVYPIAMPKETYLPKVQVGDRVDLISVDVMKEETKPPSRYTEADVIRLMTKEQIGTKSTRPQFIEILRSRGYVEGFRQLKPTRLGYLLAEQFEAIWPEFVRPTFTARVETELNLISEGKKDWRSVVEEGTTLFLKMLLALREKMVDVADKIGKSTQ